MVMTPSDDLVRMTKEQVEMWRTFATHMEHWMPSTPNPESCPVVLIEPDQLERLCDLALAQLAARAEPWIDDSDPTKALAEVEGHYAPTLQQGGELLKELMDHEELEKTLNTNEVPAYRKKREEIKGLIAAWYASAPPDRAEPQPVAELECLREIHHLAWHIFDDSCHDVSKNEVTIDLAISGDRYNELMDIIGDEHPALPACALGGEPCCGEWATCQRPCTPRGRAIGFQEAREAAIDAVGDEAARDAIKRALEPRP